MKNTSSVAIGGILTAISVLIIYLSTILPYLELVIPAFAGSLLIIFLAEGNVKWSVLVYITVSILSFIVVPNKEAVLMYIFFFGYYLIVKYVLEKKLNKKICLFIKLLIFNVSMIVSNVLLIYVFNIPFEEMERYGKYGVIILLILANIFFVIYDISLNKYIILYNVRFRKVFRKIFK